jgi:hypothetical protein
MTTKSVDVKIVPGKPGERTKVVRTYKFDASKQRKIIKSKKADSEVRAWTKKTEKR